MTHKSLNEQAQTYLAKLCQDILERSVGSEGNRAATHFVENELASLGWNTETQDFQAMDWQEDSARLQTDNVAFDIRVSPYALGCDVEATLVAASSLEELEAVATTGKILFLHGDIAKEQLMPKNFVFYNPDHHQRIIALLEDKQPAAIISATAHNAALAGGVYPVPLIEDGDVDIPSVFMTEEEGQKLLSWLGKPVSLSSKARRIPSEGCNVIARRGKGTKRIVLTAHIDAKKGSPGALDNATGVVVLLLLGHLLQDYTGTPSLELVALNGEDYYSVPGQMTYLQHSQAYFSDILLNINIDGVGYPEGVTSFALFDLPDTIERHVKDIIVQHEDIAEGPQWYQGDHSMFVQQGCAALAVTSSWFLDHMDDQTITHTPKDNLSVVDREKVVSVAKNLATLLKQCSVDAKVLGSGGVSV